MFKLARSERDAWLNWLALVRTSAQLAARLGVEPHAITELGEAWVEKGEVPDWQRLLEP